MWAEGAINTQRSGKYYRWFVPETTVSQLRRYFREDSTIDVGAASRNYGMSRSEADRIARSMVRDTFTKMTNDDVTVYFCTVTASKAGIELNSYTIGGFEFDSAVTAGDIAQTVIEHGMHDETVTGAQQSLLKLCGCH